MKIYYGQAIYDNKEISATVRVLKRNSLNLIDGPSVKKLEEKIAKLFGKKYGLMVNSGSSANLLAFKKRFRNNYSLTNFFYNCFSYISTWLCTTFYWCRGK